MPIILLTVICNRSSAGAKWFIQKVSGILVRPCILDTILKHPDHPFDLPVGLTVTNGDVVMDDTKTFSQLCKAARKLSTIVSLDVVQFAPMGNQVIV